MSDESSRGRLPLPPIVIPRGMRSTVDQHLQNSPALSKLSGLVAGASVESPKPWLLSGASASANAAASSGTGAGAADTTTEVLDDLSVPVPPLESPSKRKHGGFGAAAVAASAELSASAAKKPSSLLVPAEEQAGPQSPTKRQRSLLGSVPKLCDIFAPGMMAGRVFRIPSLLPLPDGIVLAFSEAREDWHDTGRIDLVMRRSRDGAASWDSVRVILSGADLKMNYTSTVGNPTAVWDKHTRTVWLILCSNHGRDSERAIHARQSVDSRRVWVTSSKDLGCTWASPIEITKTVKHKSWTWYATGPGIGVQLKSGRLLIPANHAEDIQELEHPFLHDTRRSRMVAHTIYSDDHGATWHLGGIAAPHTNESTLAELSNGEVIFSARDWSGEFVRQVQLSHDGGTTLEPPRYDWTLTEPAPWGCQASMLALPQSTQVSGGGDDKAVGKAGGKAVDDSGEKDSSSSVLFFCNPASAERRAVLTIRRSNDGGRSWPVGHVLDDGPSAYSCLGRLSNGSLGVLYERGDRISLATVPSSANGPLGLF